MARTEQEKHILSEAVLLLQSDGLRRGEGLSRTVRQRLLGLQTRLRQSILLYDPTQALQRSQQAGLLGLLLGVLTEAIEETYRDITMLLETETLALATEHAEALTQLLHDAQPSMTFDPESAAAALTVALQMTPFPSAVTGAMPTATASVWWERQGTALTQRLHDQMRAGVLAGESATLLARRVTGTPALQRKDGLMAQALRSAEVVAKAQAAMALTQGREAVIKANEAQVAYLVHVSMLDAETSAICEARDGKRFDPVTYAPLGHSLPYLSGIPYHFH
jgi:hypothetical protein